MSTSLSILHFNDVYRVSPQKLDPKSNDTIDVAQFSAMLDDLRASWKPADSGITLFSGDLFSPSVESSVTRGSHMVPVINALAPDVSMTGNHDFDFGYKHLGRLIKDTKFPWLLSNVVDSSTSKVPEGLHEYYVIEKAGIRIGVIGLIEKDWIATVSSWPSNFEWKDMTKTAMEISKILRDPKGPHKCDFIVALTHSRIPNDILLAKDLYALSPAEQEKESIAGKHGADLILGGHDHLYYISKGVTSWEGYDISQPSLGAEKDNGDVLVIKSGTDFRDLSEINLELAGTPEGSVRKKVIKRITGKYHQTKPGSRKSSEVQKVLETVLKSVGSTLKAPVCKTAVTLDLRSQFIRTAECAAPNWFADITRHSYDDALCMKGCGGADLTFICAGTLRGDSQYGPGDVTLGNILEILPFEDPIVVLELDGQAIWDALESSLAPWPAQEGRFPVISGFRVSWDSSKKPGERVLGVWLLQDKDDSDTESLSSSPGESTPNLVDAEPIERTKDGRKYKVVTREYMATGHDGFEAFKGAKYLVDDESGKLMSALVRQYTMGSHFVKRMSRLVSHPSMEDLHSNTKSAIHRQQKHQKKAEDAAYKWKMATAKVLHHLKTKSHYQEYMKVSATEHMSGIDPCDGAGMRKGEAQAEGSAGEDEDLLVVEPVVDGRLKDEGRQ